MRKKTRLALFFTYVMLMSFVSVAFAQEPEPPPPPEPCPGEGVSGTVVAVDEAGGVVTVDTGDMLCTVALGEGDYSHPIVALMGSFFDDVSAETLREALGEISRYAVQDENGEWMWVEEGSEGAVPVRVVGIVDNGDGTFTLELEIEGQEEHVFLTSDDPELAADLQKALDTLAVMWALNEDGTVSEAGDRIAALHEDGMGFGVLTKLFAMAQESQEACQGMVVTEGETCGVTVDELVTAFRSGAGMGQLFHEYGKPSMVGVGHVRKALKNQAEEAETMEALGDQDQDMDMDQDKDKDKKGPDHAPGQQKVKDKQKGKQKDKNKGGPPSFVNPPGRNKNK